jgi:hypothetical protein
MEHSRLIAIYNTHFSPNHFMVYNGRKNQIKGCKPCIYLDKVFYLAEGKALMEMTVGRLSMSEPKRRLKEEVHDILVCGGWLIALTDQKIWVRKALGGQWRGCDEKSIRHIRDHSFSKGRLLISGHTYTLTLLLEEDPIKMMKHTDAHDCYGTVMKDETANWLLDFEGRYLRETQDLEHPLDALRSIVTNHDDGSIKWICLKQTEKEIKQGSEKMLPDIPVLFDYLYERFLCRDGSLFDFDGHLLAKFPNGYDPQFVNGFILIKDRKNKTEVYNMDGSSLFCFGNHGKCLGFTLLPFSEEQIDTLLVVCPNLFPRPIWNILLSYL